MDELVQHLIKIGVLKTPEIIEAFKMIDRADFVPENIRDLAYIDEALPIGEGQTISQPYTVAFMLELLQPRPGDNIFEVGYGSGWQTALLAQIVGGFTPDRKGKIYAMEIVKNLCEFGKNNITKYNFIKKGIVETFCQDASSGLPAIAKKIGDFDKIIAAAALTGVRNTAINAWKEQLKIGGRVVVPIGQSIWLFIKKSATEFESYEYPGFSFVPYI